MPFDSAGVDLPISHKSPYVAIVLHQRVVIHIDVGVVVLYGKLIGHGTRGIEYFFLQKQAMAVEPPAGVEVTSVAVGNRRIGGGTF